MRNGVEGLVGGVAGRVEGNVDVSILSLVRGRREA